MLGAKAIILTSCCLPYIYGLVRDFVELSAPTLRVLGRAPRPLAIAKGSYDEELFSTAFHGGGEGIRRVSMFNGSGVRKAENHLLAHARRARRGTITCRIGGTDG